MRLRTIYLSGIATVLSVIVISAIHGNTHEGKREVQELFLPYSSEPETLNLLTANDSASTAFLSLVYEGLAERNMVDPEVWIPRLAESWDFDKETLTYTLHLRRGVKWHPMTLPNGNRFPRRSSRRMT